MDTFGGECSGLSEAPDSFERFLKEMKEIDDEQTNFQQQQDLQQFPAATAVNNASLLQLPTDQGLLDSAMYNDIEVTAPLHSLNHCDLEFLSWQMLNNVSSASASAFLNESDPLYSEASDHTSIRYPETLAMTNGYLITNNSANSAGAGGNQLSVSTVTNEKKRPFTESSMATRNYKISTNADRTNLSDQRNVYAPPSNHFIPPGNSPCDQQSLSPMSLAGSPLEDESAQSLNNGSSRDHLTYGHAPVNHLASEPRLVIVEQPVNRIRFRYGSERGAHGSSKYCPRVMVENCAGMGHISAKLYTCEPNPRSHVNKLWGGKDCSSNGVCMVPLDDNMSARKAAYSKQFGELFSFKNLGIMRVKEPDVPGVIFQALVQQQRSMNGGELSSAELKRLEVVTQQEAETMRECLSKVCIGFEAFVNCNTTGARLHLGPVFSTPIFNSHNTSFSNLKIAELAQSSGSCLGRTKIWLRCAEKIKKDDIKVVFSEPATGWTAEGLFSPSDVHGQILIIFSTPPYRDVRIAEEAPVALFLQRSSDGERSNCVEFIYLPQENEFVPRKRQRADFTSTDDRFSRNQPQGAELRSGRSNGSGTSTITFQEAPVASEFQAYRPSQTSHAQVPRMASVDEAGDEAGFDASSLADVLRRQNLNSQRKRDSSGYYSNRSSAIVDFLPGASSSYASSEGQRDSGIDLGSSGSLQKPSDSVTTVEQLHLQLDTMRRADLQTMRSDDLLKLIKSMVDNETEAIKDFCMEGSIVALLKHFPLLGSNVDADNGDSYLHIAVRNGKTEVLEAMLEAIKTLPSNLQDEFVNGVNVSQQTALHLSAVYSNSNCFKLLLNHGADAKQTDSRGDTVFHYLANSKLNNSELSDIFEAMAKDKTTATAIMNRRNNDGFAAIHLAVKASNKSVVKEFLSNQASVSIEVRNSGKTALHCAIEYSELEIMSLLLQGGADLNQRCYEDLTPLLFAVLKKNVDAVKLLLEAGANLNDTAVGTWLINQSTEEDIIEPLEADECCSSVPCSVFDLARGDEQMMFALLNNQETKAVEDKPEVIECVSSNAMEQDGILGFNVKIGVEEVDTVSRMQLCNILDNDGLWKSLASKLNCESMVEAISCVNDKDSSPTSLFLDQYQHIPNASIQNLIHALENMNKTQAVTILKHVLLNNLIAK